MRNDRPRGVGPGHSRFAYVPAASSAARSCRSSANRPQLPDEQLTVFARQPSFRGSSPYRVEREEARGLRLLFSRERGDWASNARAHRQETGTHAGRSLISFRASCLTATHQRHGRAHADVSSPRNSESRAWVGSAIVSTRGNHGEDVAPSSQRWCLRVASRSAALPARTQLERHSREPGARSQSPCFRISVEGPERPMRAA